MCVEGRKATKKITVLKRIDLLSIYCHNTLTTAGGQLRWDCINTKPENTNN